MFRWFLMFMVMAFLLSALGFTVAGHAAANIAWLLFLVFLVVFVFSFVAGMGRRSY